MPEISSESKKKKKRIPTYLLIFQMLKNENQDIFLLWPYSLTYGVGRAIPGGRESLQREGEGFNVQKLKIGGS